MFIIPKSAGLPLGVKALNYLYPVLVSLIFIFTLVVHPRMKARIIRTPLWYISSGVFTYFIGYMIYTYSLWNTTQPFVPAVYSAFLMISAAYFCLGFYAAKRKYHIRSR
jgi:FtsH-binding integral membrane protein